MGTWRVALLYVELSNVLEEISGGVVLREITVFKLVQPEKAPSPIDVTLLGMVIDARLLQPSKAVPSIIVTLLGMVTDARLVQP